MLGHRFFFVAIALVTGLAVGCGGDANSSDDEVSGGGGTSSDGTVSDGTGGTIRGTGGVTQGTGGGETCGACPGAACAIAFSLSVHPDPGVAPAELVDLQVTSDDLTIGCQRNGASCDFFCQAQEYQLNDGDYRFTVSATGFETQIVDFTIENPTNCGCCGCCPASYQGDITLTHDGTTEPNRCCEDLATDPMACDGM